MKRWDAPTGSGALSLAAVRTRQILDRLPSWLAALACLSVLVGLYDVALHSLEIVPSVPRLEQGKGPRAGLLSVRVVSAGGSPIAGAEVRVYWERDRRYFVAGEGQSRA